MLRKSKKKDKKEQAATPPVVPLSRNILYEPVGM